MTSSTSTALANIEFQGRTIQIEHALIDAHDRGEGLLVFLHEGLGSVAMWKRWPEQVCAATGCRGLVYSRYGYGGSTPRPANEKWSPGYLHDQAREALPALLRALGLEQERPVLFGHSDGGSIALLYASMYPERVRAIAVAAPHIFVEDVTVDNIRLARDAYLESDLRDRLAPYHRDVDSAFWAWNDAWLDPAFRHWNIEAWVQGIRCPILAIQGEEDEYATLEQIHGIQRRAPQTQLCAIAQCRHSPHRDKPDVVIDVLQRFLRTLPNEPA